MNISKKFPQSWKGEKKKKKLIFFSKIITTNNISPVQGVDSTSLIMKSIN